jgi:arabinose-5-phosphate isomerase
MIHPGGTLGQRLAGQVKDLMLTGPFLPFVFEGTSMQEAVETIDRGKLGTTLVTSSQNKLSGIITDGDIRRLVASGRPFLKLTVEELMTKNPQSITENSPTYDALNIMEQHQITVLPVVNSRQEVIGILHLHDILGKGEFKFNGA